MRTHRAIYGYYSCATLVTLLLLSFAVLTQADPPKEKPYGSSEEIEKMLAKWQPSKEKPHVPRKELRATDTDIEGIWEINRGNLEFSRLTITRSGPGTFVVQLYHT